MYIQITTRCNMKCDHCCFSCTSKGIDMSLEIYEKSLALAEEYDSYISLGGGEPTIHPDFWKYLGLGIASTEYLWLSTNGSITKTAIVLAKIAKHGIIGCQLSLTEFHSCIDMDVVEAFERDDSIYEIDKKDNRNTVSPFSYEDSGIIKEGRAIELNEYKTSEQCACPEIFVKPSGIVHHCECIDSPVIGNVHDGIDYPTKECYKHAET